MARVKVIVRKKTRPAFPWKSFLQKLGVTGLSGLVAWWVFLQLWSMVLPLLFRYHEVETGTIFRKLEVDQALVVRDEVVVFAPRDGTFSPVVPEGQRVAEREPVAVLQTSSGTRQLLEAPRAGVVCYHTDGWEKVLTPASIQTLDLIKWDRALPGPVETGPGAPVEAGQPLLKIVNNLQPPLIWFKFDSEYLDLFPAVGKKVRFSLGGEILEGTLKSLSTRGVIGQGLLELDRKELLHERRVELNIIVVQAEGPVIPNQALVWQDQKSGVYKKTVQGYQWVPVQVLLQDEDYSVVEGLSRGDLVITNPYLIKEASITPGN